jgi:hypothetical protein
MRRPKGFAACAVVSTLSLAALPAAAQAPLLAGAEFQVNAYTTHWQHLPCVAADAHGDFVVVWQSYGSAGPDSTGYSIQGRRFASNGSAEGSQFQVNTVATGPQIMPAVAAAADGDFIVVWQSPRSAGSDVSYESIQGQRYASDGTAQGAEFQVNTYTTEKQINPSVAAAPDGGFVVVWESSGSSGTDTSYLSLSVQGQRFASDGSLQGAQFQVNTYTTYNQEASSVAATPDGGFVVVWASTGWFGSTGLNWNILGQRYASDGSTLGSEFLVNTYTTATQFSPSVAAAADGDFVVVWRNSDSYGTGEYSIQGQRYASDGAAQGAEFQVNTYTTNRRLVPSVAAAADGAFAVLWMSEGSSGTDASGWSVQGRRYASDGSAQGAEFLVNTYTTNDQWIPSVTAGGDRDFIAVWVSAGSPGTDTDSSSIQGQRYHVAGPVAVPALSPSAGLALVATLMLLAASVLRRRA